MIKRWKMLKSMYTLELFQESHKRLQCPNISIKTFHSPKLLRLCYSVFIDITEEHNEIMFSDAQIFYDLDILYDMFDNIPSEDILPTLNAMYDETRFEKLCQAKDMVMQHHVDIMIDKDYVRLILGVAKFHPDALELLHHKICDFTSISVMMVLDVLIQRYGKDVSFAEMFYDLIHSSNITNQFITLLEHDRTKKDIDPIKALSLTLVSGSDRAFCLILECFHYDFSREGYKILTDAYLDSNVDFFRNIITSRHCTYNLINVTIPKVIVRSNTQIQYMISMAKDHALFDKPVFTKNILQFCITHNNMDMFGDVTKRIVNVDMIDYDSDLEESILDSMEYTDHIVTKLQNYALMPPTLKKRVDKKRMARAND